MMVDIHRTVPLGVTETTPVPVVVWDVEVILGGAFVDKGAFAFVWASALGFASALSTFSISLRRWDWTILDHVRRTTASETCDALTPSSLEATSAFCSRKGVAVEVPVATFVGGRPRSAQALRGC